METINLNNSLKGAKNIGPTILKRLNEIGIYSKTDLAEVTSAKAYQKICEQNPNQTFPVCYYLYSLEGALLGLHWDDVPKDLKKELLQRVDQLRISSTL